MYTHIYSVELEIQNPNTRNGGGEHGQYIKILDLWSTEGPVIINYFITSGRVGGD